MFKKWTSASDASVPATAQNSANSLTASNTSKAPTTGFFGRFTKLSRVDSVIDTSDDTSAGVVYRSPATSVVAVVDEPVVKPERQSRRGKSNASSSHSGKSLTNTATSLYVRNTELKLENEQLRKRNDELAEQLKLNQELVQQVMSMAPNEAEEKLAAENVQLRKQCKELAERLKVSQETAKLVPRANEEEIDQLRRRCDTLTEQLKASQETAKLVPRAEIDQLHQRCEELAEQSNLNQEMFMASNLDALNKDNEIQRLRTEINTLRKESTSLSERAKTAKKSNKFLQEQVESVTRESLRLKHWGFSEPAPANQAEIDTLSRQMDDLKSQNAGLQAQANKQSGKLKTTIIEYAAECNELSESLQKAETAAKMKSEQLLLQTNINKTLSAEYDEAKASLQNERKANTKLQAQILSTNHPSYTHPDLALAKHNEVLATQLVKVQRTAAEREKLIQKFKTQQQQLIDAYQADQDARAEQAKKLDACYADNQKDRKRFEEKLKAKDQRIRDLTRASKSLESMVCEVDEARDEKIKSLEDKLRRVKKTFETEVAKRASELQLAAEEKAKKRVKGLADELRRVKEDAKVEVDKRTAEMKAEARVKELEGEIVQLKDQITGLVEAFGGGEEETGGDDGVGKVDADGRDLY